MVVQILSLTTHLKARKTLNVLFVSEFSVCSLPVLPMSIVRYIFEKGKTNMLILFY